MKKYAFNLLSLSLFAACCSTTSQANLQQQCLLGVPQFQGTPLSGRQTDLPISIEADNASLTPPKEAVYSGAVSVKQGNRTVLAEKVRVEQTGNAARKAYLDGEFDYQDEQIRAKGQNAQFDFTARNAQWNDADYQFVGRQGRGTAGSVAMNEETRVLKNATYTACLPNDNAWSIEAAEMVQYVKEEYAELWHARFRVLGIPIFYSPYLQFPIGDRRRSGLLLPVNVGHSSRDGYTYGQPIYWNIAPDLDATFTPMYYSNRGWQFNPEFRYLTGLGEGLIAGEYMSKDRLKTWSENRTRRLFYWKHHVNFASDWRFSADYTKVSDRRYFSDFDSQYGSSTDGYATQHFKLGYEQPNYHFSVASKTFQTFDNSGTKPYQAFPQIAFNYYKNDWVKDGDFRFFGQLSQFKSEDKTMPTAWRLHAEPALNFPFANRYGSVNVEAKLYATHYWQRSGEEATGEWVERQVNRLLPQFKIDVRTVLESTRSPFAGVIHTLEPRVQYLYRPYKDQQNIGSKRQTNLGLGYDSALLQQDYYTLFNDRRYSGLDRIASANQGTLGATIRGFSQKTGEEIFNFSAGTIYYFSPSKIDSISEKSTAQRSHSWSLESNWKFHPQWNWHGSYQYDTRLKESALANMSLQFKPQANHLIQLNYRFASKNYINQNLSTNRYQQDIKQIGAIAAWELSDRVATVLSHYHDLALKKPVESQLALTYNTCCWSMNFYTARRLTATPIGASDTLNDFYYDNRFGVNFELRFGGSYSSGISKMLKRGIIPYSEPFGLN